MGAGLEGSLGVMGADMTGDRGRLLDGRAKSASVRRLFACGCRSAAQENAAGETFYDTHRPAARGPARTDAPRDPSRRLEEPTSELQSLMRISYAVFCMKKKTINTKDRTFSILLKLLFITQLLYLQHIPSNHSIHHHFIH